MCSILGMGFLNGHRLRNSAQIEGIIKSMLVYAKARGRDATGLAYVSADEICVVKKDESADRFVELPEYKKTAELCTRIGLRKGKNDGQGGYEDPTISVIGHCRAQTKGTYLNNKNNHPIVRRDVVGVHNGWISNDDELFAMFSKMFPRNAEVDSEIIFALIEYFAAGDKKLHEAISMASRLMAGSLACAMVHKLQPHVVWLFRRHGPCDITLYEDPGVVMWASDRSYYKKAVKDNNVKLGAGTNIELPANSGVAIDLHRNKIYKFPVEVNSRGASWKNHL